MSDALFMPRFHQARLRSAPRRGFTLLEIILVIALMGLLATVLSVGAASLLRDRAAHPEDVVWSAIAESRKFALLHETEVWLSYDNQERFFTAATALGARQFPVPEGAGEFDLTFLGMAKGEQSILIAGRLIETSTIDGVRFFPDGTCTPFRVQLVEEGKQPEVLEVDPWTCAPALDREATP